MASWDGRAWSAGASANASEAQANQLAGVACASAADCWAVGRYFNGVATQTLILHWNGQAWLQAVAPNTSVSTFNQLYGVTCVSAADCWAVGYADGFTALIVTGMEPRGTLSNRRRQAAEPTSCSA